MASELKKKIEERKKQKALEQIKNIYYCCPFTSEQIMEAFLPKTKTQNWYFTYCVGLNQVPEKAVNGHNGGTPFYSKDKKIMRSGASTWSELEIKTCR